MIDPLSLAAIGVAFAIGRATKRSKLVRQGQALIYGPGQTAPKTGAVAGPETRRPFDQLVGLPLRFSQKQRQELVGDVTAPVQAFTDVARRRLQKTLSLAAIEEIKASDVNDALTFRLVPLPVGERSALEAVEEAEKAGAAIFLSLSCVLDHGNFDRLVAWSTQPRPMVARSRDFARFQTPAPVEVLVAEVVSVPAPVAAPAAPVASESKPNGVAKVAVPAPVKADATRVE